MFALKRGRPACCKRSWNLTSARLPAIVALSCLKLQILKLHSLLLDSSGSCVGVQRHMRVLECRLWLLRAVTVCRSVPQVRGSRVLAGEGARVNSNGDWGGCCYCGDGLAKWGGIGVEWWGVVVGLRDVGSAAPVARWAFSMAVGAVMAPGLSSSFKSIHARAGWGRGFPVHLASGVPAAISPRTPMLEPRIATLRGNRL